MENLEKLFNEMFNLSKITNEAIDGAKAIIHNESLKADVLEAFDKIENIEYVFDCVVVVLNDSFRCNPFFRVKIVLIDVRDAKRKAWYDLEFNSKGEISDDFFDFFSICVH